MKLKFFFNKKWNKGLVLIILIVVRPFIFNSFSFGTNDTLLETFDRLEFVENKGQFIGGENEKVPYVLFKTELPGLNIWVTETGLTYQFFTIEKEQVYDVDGMPKIKADGRKETVKYNRWTRVDMVIEGANISKDNLVRIDRVGTSERRYFNQYHPNGIEGVHGFSKLKFKNILKGIDWLLYTNSEGHLKHDFVLHPGANIEDIKLIYEGSGEIKISENNIRFFNELGEIKEGELICYQKKIVESEYRVKKNDYLTYKGAGNFNTNQILNKTENVFSCQVQFDVKNYDKNKELVIDPQLVWGTMFGGNNLDGFQAADTDADGNLFVVGYTNATTFPVQNAGTFYQGVNAGANDAVLVKFSNAGVLLWSTYYGGSNVELGQYVAVDNLGNVILVGETRSNDFPVQNAGTFFQGASGGGTIDGFIVKFDNLGNRLWSTYYGGTGNDKVISADFDPSGNLWLTGHTTSTDFPVQNSGTFFQGVNGGSEDMFLLKFTNNGTRVLATYYGGSNIDQSNSVYASQNGEIFLTGSTRSLNFPTQNSGGFFQGVFAGGVDDAAIVKFDNAGNRLWSTYYGGSGDEQGSSVITDYLGNTFITGKTNSNNFPVQNAGTFFQPTKAFGFGFPAPNDIFILKFDNTDSRIWATYYGGTGNDRWAAFDNLAVDNCNNLYVSFDTQANNIVTFNPGGGCHYYDGTFAGGGLTNSDNLIAKFDNLGNMLWASYVGGNEGDFRAPLAVDSSNNLFMCGEFTNYGSSATLPMQNPGGGAYFDSSPNGSDDSFVMKFEPAKLVTNLTSIVDATTCTPCDGSATISVSPTACSPAPFSYVWSNGSQTNNSFSTSNTVSGLCPGNYTITTRSSNCSQDVTAFTVNGPNCSLPIELLYFDAILIDDNYVKLEWTTLGEINNDFFTIERSKDLEIFQPISIVNGSGNSNQQLHYLDFDFEPLTGISYYRLKQTDFDGKYSYSGIKAINIVANTNASIYTRSNDELIVHQNSIEGEKTRYQIVDLLGRVLIKGEIYQKRKIIDISTLSVGMYIILLEEQDQSFKFRKLQ